MCVDEGIDELAEFCGAGKAVAEWTARLNIFFIQLFKMALLSAIVYIYQYVLAEQWVVQCLLRKH